MKNFFLLLSSIFLGSLVNAQPCPPLPCPFQSRNSVQVKVNFCTDPANPDCFSEEELRQVFVSYRYWYNDDIKTHQETFTNLAAKGFQLSLSRQTQLQYMILDHQITLPALGRTYTFADIRTAAYREEECSCPKTYITQLSLNDEVFLFDNYYNNLTLMK